MTGDRAREGTVIHVDVVSEDERATRAFLEGAFGWKFRAIPFAHYALFEAPSPPHGGLRRVEANERAGARAYLAVDSLDEARGRIEKAGGRVLGDEQKVPGFGRFVLFEAPGRVVLGAFEEK